MRFGIVILITFYLLGCGSTGNSRKSTIKACNNEISHCVGKIAAPKNYYDEVILDMRGRAVALITINSNKMIEEISKITDTRNKKLREGQEFVVVTKKGFRPLYKNVTKSEDCNDDTGKFCTSLFIESSHSAYGHARAAIGTLGLSLFFGPEYRRFSEEKFNKVLTKAGALYAANYIQTLEDYANQQFKSLSSEFGSKSIFLDFPSDISSSELNNTSLALNKHSIDQSKEKNRQRILLNRKKYELAQFVRKTFENISSTLQAEFPEYKSQSTQVVKPYYYDNKALKSAQEAQQKLAEAKSYYEGLNTSLINTFQLRRKQETAVVQEEFDKIFKENNYDLATGDTFVEKYRSSKSNQIKDLANDALHKLATYRYELILGSNEFDEISAESFISKYKHEEHDQAALLATTIEIKLVEKIYIRIFKSKKLDIEKAEEFISSYELTDNSGVIKLVNQAAVELAEREYKSIFSSQSIVLKSAIAFINKYQDHQLFEIKNFVSYGMDSVKKHVLAEPTRKKIEQYITLRSDVSEKNEVILAHIDRYFESMDIHECVSSVDKFGRYLDNKDSQYSRCITKIERALDKQSAFNTLKALSSRLSSQPKTRNKIGSVMLSLAKNMDSFEAFLYLLDRNKNDRELLGAALESMKNRNHEFELARRYPDVFFRMGSDGKSQRGGKDDVLDNIIKYTKKEGITGTIASLYLPSTSSRTRPKFDIGIEPMTIFGSYKIKAKFKLEVITVSKGKLFGFTLQKKTSRENIYAYETYYFRTPGETVVNEVNFKEIETHGRMSLVGIVDGEVERTLGEFTGEIVSVERL